MAEKKTPLEIFQEVLKKAKESPYLFVRIAATIAESVFTAQTNLPTEPNIIRNQQRPEEPKEKKKKPERPKIKEEKPEEPKVQTPPPSVLLGEQAQREKAALKALQQSQAQQSRPKQEKPQEKPAKPEPVKKPIPTLANTRTVATEQQKQPDFSALRQALEGVDEWLNTPLTTNVSKHNVAKWSLKEVWIMMEEEGVGKVGEEAIAKGEQYQERFDQLRTALEKTNPEVKSLRKMKDFIQEFVDACVDTMQQGDPNQTSHQREELREGILQLDELQPVLALQKACDSLAVQITGPRQK